MLDEELWEDDKMPGSQYSRVAAVAPLPGMGAGGADALAAGSAAAAAAAAGVFCIGSRETGTCREH